jgi:hypothetical protein
MSKRKTITQKFPNVKAYAKHLMLRVMDTDPEGRFVGLSYDKILRKVRQAFPIITYNGPHKGRAIKMTVKQLREIAYSMQSEERNLRLPVRPRSKRQKTPSTATISPPKAEPGPAATISRRKG